MALGLAAERIGSDRLDVRWNTPIHDPSRIPPTHPSRPSSTTTRRSTPTGGSSLHRPGRRSTGQSRGGQRGHRRGLGWAAPVTDPPAVARTGAATRPATTPRDDPPPARRPARRTDADHGDAVGGGPRAVMDPPTRSSSSVPTGQAVDGRASTARPGDLTSAADALVHLSRRADYLASGRGAVAGHRAVTMVVSAPRFRARTDPARHVPRAAVRHPPTGGARRRGVSARPAQVETALFVALGPPPTGTAVTSRPPRWPPWSTAIPIRCR